MVGVARAIPTVARMTGFRFLIPMLLALVVCAAMPAHAASRICMSADTLTFGQREVGTTTSASVTVSK